MPIRIVIADDHAMFRESVVERLNREPDLRVVQQTSDSASTLFEVSRTTPDILLLDLSLRESNGIAVLQQLKHSQSPTRIIALTGFVDRFHVTEAMRCGASGYVPKSASMSDLVAAIRHVHAGRIYLAPEITSYVVEGSTSGQREPETSPHGLTGREIGIVKLIARGLSSREIAESLQIAQATVDVHRRNIRKKLGVSKAAEITRLAIEQKITD